MKRVALVSCPNWSQSCPPYNLSLLSGILKHNNYESKVFDLNIECFNYLLNEKENYWKGNNYFYWIAANFEKEILPKIETVINETVQTILNYKPDVVGFSVYETNVECVKYVINKIKSINESIQIMIGGPHCFEMRSNMLNVDFLFNGESETAILDALNSETSSTVKFFKNKESIKLDELPFANYDDYDLSKYNDPYSIAMEASRGCVAKCSFCLETHFWLYRSKTAKTLINEVKYYKEKYNVKHIRFNDSLVNGNLKEFKKFIELLSQEKLGIRWEGYARINKNMDLDFMKTLKKSGNNYLSFGVESGSQKVLDDMNKGIKLYEIEQNLEDAKNAKIKSQLNWIIGFPTETTIDYSYSLAFVFNNRENIWQLCPGMTCGIGSSSDLGKNRKKYNIKDGRFWRGFATEHFTNTAINRFIRLKLFHIWLDILNINNGQYHNNIKNEYNIKFLNKKNNKRIDYNDCIDFRYLNKDNFESSLYSEYMSFFWIIYQAYGSYEMDVSFDYIRDKEEFGSSIVNPYYSKANFSINDNGEWTFSINHTLKELIIFDVNIEIKGSRWDINSIELVSGNNSLLKKTDKNTFCPIPWIHSSCNTMGHIRACCICCFGDHSLFRKDDGTIYNVNIDRIPRNNRVLKNMRSRMIKGEKEPLCEPCYEREKSGFYSNRLINHTNFYPEIYDKALELTKDDGTINPDDFPIKYYDIRMGNICNSRCIMCNDSSSSMWGGKGVFRVSIDAPYMQELLKNVNHIDKIYIAGGEPLIHKDLWKVLNIIIESGYSNNIDLQYNTNATIMKKKFFKIWKNFNRVNLGFSIDGCGNVYEKVRYPSKWENVKSNLRMFEKYSENNTYGVITSTIITVNVLNIIELFKWLRKQKFEKIVNVPHFNISLRPYKFNIRNLPDSEKLKIKNEYDKFYAWAEKHYPQDKSIKQNFSLIINSMMKRKQL